MFSEPKADSHNRYIDMEVAQGPYIVPRPSNMFSEPKADMKTPVT